MKVTSFSEIELNQVGIMSLRRPATLIGSEHVIYCSPTVKQLNQLDIILSSWYWYTQICWSGWWWWTFLVRTVMMIGECCSKFLSSENMLLYKEHTFCHSSRFSPLKSLRKIHILIFKAFCSRPDICSPRCTLVTLKKNQWLQAQT